MTGQAPLPKSWTAWRRTLFVALIFTGQLALIFWLGDSSPKGPRPREAPPVLQFAVGASPELLALNDPTLFALPHQQGFSGAAWLKKPKLQTPSSDWLEPATWLALSTARLGETIEGYMETNHPVPTRVLSASLPEPAWLPPSRMEVAPEQSTLHIAGALAQRRLLTPLVLSSRTNATLLTNSIIQVVVDAQGRSLSATLLGPGSGSPAADQDALRMAQTAQFEPLAANHLEASANALANLTWGKMIFEWRTIPPASVAAPAQ
jgi:TonB family protein